MHLKQAFRGVWVCHFQTKAAAEARNLYAPSPPPHSSPGWSPGLRLVNTVAAGYNKDEYYEVPDIPNRIFGPGQILLCVIKNLLNIT